MRRTVLFIFGTRPEAIKLCPLLLKLRSFPELYSTKVCVTGQHRGMLDQVLAAFGVMPDYDLNVMTPGQTLFQSTARIIQALEQPFAESKPDLAVVQGDTTTTFCGALAAFYGGVPVVHVEAGLRTGDLGSLSPKNSTAFSQPGWLGRTSLAPLEPMDYVPFVDLMRPACLILTDSGGTQEEGSPSENLCWFCGNKPNVRKRWKRAQ